MHRALSGHFNKHFRVGRAKWYRRADTHPLFRRDDEGKTYREEVLNETADPTELPKNLRESLATLKTKKVDGITVTPDLYTGVVTTAAGDIIPITEQEWASQWKNAAKGKAVGGSGVTTDMLGLAPPGLFDSHRDIANAALAGGCIPGS